MHRGRFTAALVCAGLGALSAPAQAQRRAATPPSPSPAPVAVASPAPASPAPAVEAPPDPRVAEARQHFDQGAVFFERENYEAASAEFQRAYDLLDGNPHQYTVLFNIGQTQERLFQYDAALTSYQQYLDRGGEDAEDRATVQATIRALGNLLATMHLTTNVPRADVWLDDRRIGSAPGDLRIPGGRHVVQLRAPGYLPNQVEVSIVARARRDVIINLTRIPTNRGISPIVFGSAVGVTVVAAAVGAGFGVAAMLARGDVDTQLADPVLRWRSDRLLAEQQDIGRMALAADILYGGAAVFAITSGILFFFTDFRGRHDTPRPQARVTPLLSPGLAGAGFQGVF